MHPAAALRDFDEPAAMPRALASLYYGANVGIQCCTMRGEPEEWL